MQAASKSEILKSKEYKSTNDWQKLKFQWHSDLYRYTGRTGLKQYLHALTRNTSYQYTFLMRLCTCLSHNRGNIFKKFVFRIVYEIFRLFAESCAIEITFTTSIGNGLYIPHPLGIVIHQDAIIGKNCHISQNVTIGQLNRGSRKGTPVIGDNVYISPGAIVLGNIHVGSNSIIGSNSVVIKDVPENAVVAGSPAQIISFQGSQDYIVRIDY